MCKCCYYYGLFFTGLSIVFKNVTYSSSTEVIPLTSVGVGEDGVICMTTRTDCCKDVTPNGEWDYPNGSMVPRNDRNEDFYRSRGTQQVILNRRNDAVSPTGCFCCELVNPTERICITLSSKIINQINCCVKFSGFSRCLY